MNENPTREKIIFLLKQRGTASIDELSKELNITSMGIRQHLLSLERRGLIDYITKRQGIGRPAFLYKLTEKADELFPKMYDQFLVALLKDIEKNEGRDKVDEIFKWRKARLLRDAKELLADKKTMIEKINGLREMLEFEGYLSELIDNDNHYNLKLYNCPLSKLANEFREMCRHDLQMFRDLLGREVSRETCITEGNPFCSYTIPKTLSRI